MVKKAEKHPRGCFCLSYLCVTAIQSSQLYSGPECLPKDKLPFRLLFGIHSRFALSFDFSVAAHERSQFFYAFYGKRRSAERLHCYAHKLHRIVIGGNPV